MKMIARKALRYAARNVAAGEEFEVSNPRDVRTLKAIRRADLVPEATAGDEEGDPKTPARARRYQRRDMQAED
jgi:hypothetical protein